MKSVIEEQYFTDFGLSYLESQWRKIRNSFTLLNAGWNNTVFMPRRQESLILEQDRKETIGLNIYILTGDTHTHTPHTIIMIYAYANPWFPVV